MVTERGCAGWPSGSTGAPVLWSPASAPLRLGEGGGIHAMCCVPTIINQNLAKLKLTCRYWTTRPKKVTEISSGLINHPTDFPILFGSKIRTAVRISPGLTLTFVRNHTLRTPLPVTFLEPNSTPSPPKILWLFLGISLLPLLQGYDHRGRGMLLFSGEQRELSKNARARAWPVINLIFR